jgi:hypothetical protein
VLQLYALPVVAVSVTLPPEQKVVGPEGVIDTVGSGLTVIVVIADVLEQVFPSVTVTE